ncbi:hypothetical protein BUALT_Bualt09G0081400 [Buddleja alternifolia]|uniref:RING-type E3 ubiquitin transferase n=1 Tax=Buddleja alternifolia TaxID=168488 RepID=A0AAV6X590_9LAMI|nr:hypothetical protein BUALT_Bualt09G0081400 [Buddleja alternifolia]
MDREYRLYVTAFLEEQGIEPPPGFFEDEEEDEDEDEDEESEQDSEEEEEEDDEENDDVAEVGGPSGTITLRQVLYGNQGNDVNSVGTTTSSQEIVNVEDEDADNVAVDGERGKGCQIRNIDETKGGGTSSSKGDEDKDNEGELNRGEIDGLFCPICFEAWSSGGDHHICCLPCGHIYGLSCIKKWLRRRDSSKCPQCKKKCGLKDIRLLYATRIVAVDGELQKVTVRSLEAKCTSLEKKNADLSLKEVEWKKRETDMSKQMRYLKERTNDLENLLEEMERRASASASSWNCQGESALGLDANPKSHMRGCYDKFVMQKDLQVDGARLFDIDSSSKIFVIARRLPGLGGMHVLTKQSPLLAWHITISTKDNVGVCQMSLFSNHEKEDIRLPENTKAVKDLCVSPHSGLVLLASLGKKLSVLSTESNNTILAYDLPAAAWSCSWDICSSHYVYAGLQNGTVLQFDMRYTMRHVESLTGLTGNPIHTIQSLSPDSSLNAGVRSVLTASSLGICQWNFGRGEERPYLIPDSDKQGVCISLASCPRSDDIVASYRPKIEISSDLEITQPTLTASVHAIQGTHVLYKKMGLTYQKITATCANVSDIRLPKSAIIDGVSGNPMFASGDEMTHDLVLQDIPSLMVVQHLKPRQCPIRDVKYTRLLNSGLLSCLSGDSLQLFKAELL